MQLLQLVYVSRVGREVRLSEAEAIAKQSAVRNAESSITGFLLYTPQYFLQVLEGEPAPVEETFARIHRDPRHSEVQVLGRDPIESRSFADWNMGFAMHKDLTSTPAGGFQAETVLALLREVAQQQR